MLHTPLVCKTFKEYCPLKEKIMLNLRGNINLKKQIKILDFSLFFGK
jgi:hypothetical protein